MLKKWNKKFYSSKINSSLMYLSTDVHKKTEELESIELFDCEISKEIQTNNKLQLPWNKNEVINSLCLVKEIAIKARNPIENDMITNQTLFINN